MRYLLLILLLSGCRPTIDNYDLIYVNDFLPKQVEREIDKQLKERNKEELASSEAFITKNNLISLTATCVPVKTEIYKDRGIDNRLFCCAEYEKVQYCWDTDPRFKVMKIKGNK